MQKRLDFVILWMEIESQCKFYMQENGLNVHLNLGHKPLVEEVLHLDYWEPGYINSTH